MGMSISSLELATIRDLPCCNSACGGTFEYSIVAYPESNSLLEWDQVSNQVPKTSSKALSLTRREKNENFGVCWAGEFFEESCQ